MEKKVQKVWTDESVRKKLVEMIEGQAVTPALLMNVASLTLQIFKDMQARIDELEKRD